MTLRAKYFASNPSITSYDFVDLTQAVGILSLYGYSAINSGTYAMNNHQIYSEDISTGQAIATGGSYTQFFNVQFSTTINKPMNCKGTTTINLPVRLAQVGGATADGIPSIVLHKISGGVTTQLLANSGATFRVLATEDKYFVATIMATLPLTHFKKNDTLRLSVQGQAQSNGGGTATFKLGHDPKNRATAGNSQDNWGSNPSQLAIYMPVKIDK